ncbi:Mfa1 family fimbria major subunit [Parabacteroides segnis]|nr:Mfa1 family fimbria major subunit [Parabacteroides segnis]
MTLVFKKILLKTIYIKKIALAILTAWAIFTSCSNEMSDQGKTGDKDGPVGYISLILSNSSVRGTETKALDSLHYGTADENKVKSVLIVLYNGDDPVTSEVKYRFVLADIGTPASPGSDIHSILQGTNTTTYRTKAKEVIKDNYKLAVFINPPAALKDLTTEGEKLGIMTAAAEVSVDQLTMGEKIRDNFLMSNFAGLVNVAKDDIYDTEAKAEAAPVKLDVERAVAKVTLSVADNLKTASATLGANIGEIKWDVDVVNRKTFWMRNAAPMLDKNSISSGIVTQTIPEIAISTNRIYMYATDPNWDGISHNRNPSLIAPLTDEFTYKSGTIALPLTPSTSDEPTEAYVTENTMVASEQWEDVTTCVLISAVITPKTTYFGTSLPPGTQYFLFRNMAFTFTDIQQIHAAYNDPETIITSAGKTWKVLTEEAANASIIVLPGILERMKGSEDFNGYTAVPDTSKDVVKSNGTVSFFAAGAPNYYYVPIRHFRDELQSESMAYGRYGVVRNSWYNLLLTSIKNYGTGEIPKDRPEPDDKDKSWLSVEFTILPWVERGQGIEL